MSDLDKTLADIRMDQFDRFHAQRGPNKWLEVRKDPANFGKDFDYRIMDGDVFMPACKAAQEFVYYTFPEGCNNYTDLDGFVGVRVEGGLHYIVLAASNAGLLSENEYDALQENEQIIRQENNDA